MTGLLPRGGGKIIWASEKRPARHLPDYRFGSITSRNLQSCSENRTNRGRHFFGRDVPESRYC